jgi:hypothetical protein
MASPPLSAAHFSFHRGTQNLDTTGERNHCVVEAPVPIVANDRRPMWVSGLINAPMPCGRVLRSHFASSQPPSLLLLPSTPTAQLSVKSRHRPPPSPSE